MDRFYDQDYLDKIRSLARAGTTPDERKKLFEALDMERARFYARCAIANAALGRTVGRECVKAGGAIRR
jgi:hypothetical protein